MNKLILNLRDWLAKGDWEAEDFSYSTFWVQSHGLPWPILTDENAKKVATKVGKLLEVQKRKLGVHSNLHFLCFKVDDKIDQSLPVGFF